MKILAVSVSPYLLVRSGRLCADILSFLAQKKYEVAAAVDQHDVTWFAPDADNRFFFKDVCEIFPFNNRNPKTASPQLYEIVSKYNPDVVLSIGSDYNEVDALFAIKSLNPDMFKWIHILTLDAIPIKDTYYDLFSKIDYMISTNQIGMDETDIFPNLQKEKCLVGVNPEIFNFSPQKENNDTLKILCCGKNSQATGIGSLIKASQNLNNCEIYCNLVEVNLGDYDLELLKKRYDKNNIIKFPEKYVGLNDGFSDIEMNEIYNNSDIFVDVSVRSATGMCLLEALSAGCVPITTKIGALKEIIELLPRELQFFVESNTYIGNFEEEYQIVDPNSIIENIEKIRKLKENKEGFLEIKHKIVEVVKTITRNNFLREIEKSLDFVEKEKGRITLKLE
jgi:glycosyltransferase involved in cell wall biosynthesis